MMTTESDKNNKQEKQYLRMTVNERFQHFFLLSSFITLVITGFALKFPEAMWVRWFSDLFGDGAFEFRGDLHRIAAGVMVAVSFYHIGYIIFTKRGRKFFADMWFKKTDITDITQSLMYYIGKTKERPKFRRFSYIEKMEYWAVAWGTIVMGVSGSLLWFENTFLPIISMSGMDIATAIHYYEAILASLAIVVWHFYFVIYNPDVYPMNKAWFTGHLSKEEMELEHPLWLEEIEKEEQKNKDQKEEQKESETEKEEIVKIIESEISEADSAETAQENTAEDSENNIKNIEKEETGKDGSSSKEVLNTKSEETEKEKNKEKK